MRDAFLLVKKHVLKKDLSLALEDLRVFRFCVVGCWPVVLGLDGLLDMCVTTGCCASCERSRILGIWLDSRRYELLLKVST